MCHLDIPLGVDDGDLISDAVVIAKVHKPDGSVAVVMRTTTGTDWVTRRGLIATASDVESTNHDEVD